MSDLGKRIRAARKSAGLSQEALARRAELSLNSMGSLERGEALDPHISTLSGIADALGMSVGELLEEPALSGKVEAPLPLEVAETPGRGYPLMEAFTGIFSDLSEGHGPRITNLSEDLPPSRSLAAYQWVAGFIYTCELVEYQLDQKGVREAVISLLDRADDGEDIPADLLRKARDFEQAWAKLLVKDWASAHKWVESQLERPEVMEYSEKNKQEAEERQARETGTADFNYLQDHTRRTRAEPAAAG